MKTRIIVDSTADLVPEIKERVYTVPLTVHFGQEEYIDGVTIDHRTFYEKLVGVLSGLIGVLIARLLIIPVNIILKDLTGLSNVAILDPLHALLLIVISTALTLIGGAIPANMASKKDPVIALRTE